MTMLASSLPNKTLLSGGKEVVVEGGDTVAFLCPGVAFEVFGLAAFWKRRPASNRGTLKVKMAKPVGREGGTRVRGLKK
jgi:hypothetical protein